MYKRRQTSVDSRIRVLLTLLFTVAFITGVKAQDYVITTAETWLINQTLSTNVIVDAGGTLTIAAGVTVGFNYADVNADSTGDFKIEVKNGGKLVINGTYANPVIFQGAGSAPPAYAGTNKWWQGLVMTSTTGSVLNFLTIKNAPSAMQIGGALDLSGITIDGAINGITVSNTLGGTVNINAPTLSNITGKGIVVNNGTTNIRFATLTNITDNGIEVNAPNVTIDWASVVNASTGLYNSASATNTVVTNSSFTGNKKSGLFNVDGTITVTNSKFNSNTFHGIVNSSGTLTLTQADISNNTSRGLLLAGAGTSTVKNVTDTANGNVGVDIITLKQVADVLVPAGTAETTMPTVSFLYSNIYSNSKTSTPANLQVRSLATSASPVADFTTTWWGVNTGIINLVSSLTPGAVNYANWRTAGAYAVVSTANLSPSKSITITYPVAGQNLLQNKSFNVTWTSVGNIPYVIVNHTTGAGNTLRSYNVVPNTGSFAVTPPTADPIAVVNVKNYASDSSSVNSAISSLAIIANTTIAPAMAINRPTANDTLRSNAQFTVKWTAPAVVTHVKLTYSPSGTFPDADNVVLAASVDATLGSYVVTMPASVVYGITSQIEISDVTPNGSAVTAVESSAFTTFANPPWAFTPSGYSMNLAVKTLVFAAANPDLANPTVESEDSYLGAFFTNPSGQRQCVGYAQSLGILGDPVSPTAVTAFAAAPAPRAATHTLVTTASTTGLVAGRFVTISGSSVAAYNGTFQISTITLNTSFEITVPFTANTTTASTWKYNNATNFAAAPAPRAATHTTVTTYGTDPLVDGDRVTISGTHSTSNGTFVASNVVAGTSFEIEDPFVAIAASNITGISAALGARAATHSVVLSNIASLANGGTVTIAGAAAAYNGVNHVVSNVNPGISFEIAVPNAAVVTTGIGVSPVAGDVRVYTNNTGLIVGSTVNIINSAVAAYNGTKTVTSLNAGTSFDFTQAIAPTTITVIGVGAVTTITAAGHGLVNGDKVMIANVGGADAAEINNTNLLPPWTVTRIDDNQFTIALNSAGKTYTPDGTTVCSIADAGVATWTKNEPAAGTVAKNEYTANWWREADAVRGYRSLTIWGDDPTTSSVKEGPADGDPVTFSLYQAGYTTATNPDGILPARLSDSTDLVAPVTVPVNPNIYDSVASVTYNLNSYVGYLSAFSREGYGEVAVSTTGTVTRTEAYPAAGAWYLYSTNILPAVNTFAPNPLTGSFMESFGANVLIAKNSAGDVYWPAYGINRIDANGGWKYHQAYYVKVGDGTNPGTATFTLTGSKITPESNPVALNQGWNYVPYLRESAMNIATALSSISKYLVIVKQDDGKVFWPAYSINEIGNMTAGKGYLVKVTEATTLTYPSNSYVGKENAIAQSKNAVHFVVSTNSDNSSIIGIMEEALTGKVQVNDEVGVFNSDGILVGSSVYNGGNLAVVVWGLESGAKKGFGMKEGEAYSIKVWNKAANQETLLAGATYTIGSGVYSNNGISMISKVEGLQNVLPKEYAISQNYPNPFNPTTVISYALPTDSRVKISVYNILGQLVKELVNTDMKAGYHKVNFNAAGLASGVYMYQIDAGNFHQAKKMNLLK